MSQIFLLVFFLKGSSWAHCHFVFCAPALVLFPSLLTCTKGHLCECTRQQMTPTEDLRRAVHTHKCHCDVIFLSPGFLICWSWSISILYSESVVELKGSHSQYTQRPNTYPLPDHSLHTVVPHRSVMRKTFTPIIYCKGILEGWGNIHLYFSYPLTETGEALLGEMNVSVENMHS